MRGWGRRCSGRGRCVGGKLASLLPLQALYVTDHCQAGTVFVNTYNKTDVAAPFGGFKQSGYGKDLGEWPAP